MTRIGLLSDTHGYIDEAVFRHFETCDTIWHAGDLGTADVADRLAAFRPFTGVYGNIDGPDIRHRLPEQHVFLCEGVKVLIRHIGGIPPRYNPATRSELDRHRPNLFITGHSHILKIMYDRDRSCMFMNPGAAGRQGWHKIRTLVRFAIDGTDLRDCEVIELGKR